MPHVIVSGSFDNLRFRHVRLLHEASRHGNVHVLLWSDEVVQELEGTFPKFSLAERLYTLQSIRFVDQVTTLTQPVNQDSLPDQSITRESIWVVDETSDTPFKLSFSEAHALDYLVIHETELQDFPALQPETLPINSTRKKVIVTGCFDWLHSGHIRFFEEVSQLGDLYVVVGHDDNVRLLKGEGHPLFSQEERRYMVQSIRFVRQALISSGTGWMDAEPEIERIKPDIYAVNEDGDKPEKRAFCAQYNLEYIVFKRLPKEGLPRRESTDLRGF